MLSRIARGLYGIGRDVERAQNVMRILEVNHKMHLEHESVDRGNVWLAISESFETGLDGPSEPELYRELVLSTQHPSSVRRCITSARTQGRAMRDHISEEMWLHLNHTYLDLADLSFGAIVARGRSEFNREIEVFCDAFHGLADDTMIHGPPWYFLRIGKFFERLDMICRILEIKRKTLSLSPEEEGHPVDFHQWQSLLRSISGYEPYRRAYDARIEPARVLEFVLKREDFPRSLVHSVDQVALSLQAVAGGNPAQLDLCRRLDHFREGLRSLDTGDLLRTGSLEDAVRGVQARTHDVAEAMEVAFFGSLRPAPAPISAAPGAGLVPQ